MEGKCPMCGADGAGRKDGVHFNTYRFDFQCGTHVMYAPWAKPKVWPDPACYAVSQARQQNKAKTAA